MSCPFIKSSVCAKLKERPKHPSYKDTKQVESNYKSSISQHSEPKLESTFSNFEHSNHNVESFSEGNDIMKILMEKISQEKAEAKELLEIAAERKVSAKELVEKEQLGFLNRDSAINVASSLSDIEEVKEETSDSSSIVLSAPEIVRKDESGITETHTCVPANPVDLPFEIKIQEKDEEGRIKRDLAEMNALAKEQRDEYFALLHKQDMEDEKLAAKRLQELQERVARERRELIEIEEKNRSIDSRLSSLRLKTYTRTSGREEEDILDSLLEDDG